MSAILGSGLEGSTGIILQQLRTCVYICMWCTPLGLQVVSVLLRRSHVDTTVNALKFPQVLCLQVESHPGSCAPLNTWIVLLCNAKTWPSTIYVHGQRLL